MWLIKQEESKEDERNKLLLSITDKTERMRLDKIFGYERRHAAMKIQNLKKFSVIYINYVFDTNILIRILIN